MKTRKEVIEAVLKAISMMDRGESKETIEALKDLPRDENACEHCRCDLKKVKWKGFMRSYTSCEECYWDNYESGPHDPV